MDEILCPACGAPNPVESTICETCGEDLGAVRSVMDSANTHYNEALALAHQDRLDEAIGKMEAALALSAQNPQYHNLLGTLYAQKEQYGEAIHAWERALTIDPEMEKAYRSIEKAHKMEGEEEEEQRNRPFLLAAIGAGVIALLCLALTAYFGMKSYLKTQSIGNMNRQIAQLNQDKDALRNEARTWKEQIDAINNQFPGGIDGISQHMTQLQNQLSERQISYEQLQQNRNAEVEALQKQIENMRQQNQQLQARANESTQLDNSLRTTQAQIRQLQEQISQKDAEIKTLGERAENLRQSEQLAQETIRSVKADRDRAIGNLLKSNDNSVNELRMQMQNLRDEVAQYEQTTENIREANHLIIQALQNLQENRFELAMQNVDEALQTAPNHPTAQYMQTYVQNILNDPVEQSLRQDVARSREQARNIKRDQLVASNLQDARQYYNQGQYDLAIRMADQVIALQPANSNDAEAARRIRQQAEEGNRALSMMMLEARRSLEAGNVQQARSTLDQILRRAPKYADALALQREITQ